MQKLEFEDTIFRRKFSISARGKLIDLSTPKVMGILNVTPDSFYAGSRIQVDAPLNERVKAMLIAGADILDIGGYSSRPGAEDVSAQEEIDRVCPAIASICRDFPDAVISIDTFRSDVAEQAILAGASIINDISGFEQDEQLPAIAGKYQTPYILMHMRGTPKTMQSLTTYENIFVEMATYFSQKIDVLQKHGVKDIILDPGFGFSKTLEDNYRLLRNMDYFEFLNRPILAGLSRKSMIYKKLNISPEEALEGTIALNTVALMEGASILRVHDVKEAADLIQLLK